MKQNCACSVRDAQESKHGSRKFKILYFTNKNSCHVENVSIYFIIELASQSNIINEQLSSSVISKLCIKKLYLMSPEHYIDRFLNKVGPILLNKLTKLISKRLLLNIKKLFIEQNSYFKLSGNILKFLMENYDEYNFSISGFIHALKYCFYEHLNSNMLNALFLSSQLDELDFYESIMVNILQFFPN